MRNYDSVRYHFDIYRDNQFTDFLWKLSYCVSCLSRPRQEQQEKKIMPTPSANEMGASHWEVNKPLFGSIHFGVGAFCMFNITSFHEIFNAFFKSNRVASWNNPTVFPFFLRIYSIIWYINKCSIFPDWVVTSSYPYFLKWNFSTKWTLGSFLWSTPYR